MNTKVSIIVPTLNVVQYIRECMNSIILQSLKEIEIICVDAGSDDGTKEILKEYLAKDLRVILIESSIKSYGYQMNLAIEKAHGKYIGIVESDDYIATDMFKKLYEIAELHKVDFVKSAFDQFWTVNDRRVFIPRVERRIIEVADKKIDLSEHRELGIADINHIWSGLYNREFLVKKEIVFNETLGASYQDTSFSILVGLLAESCVYTLDTFYKYRKDNPNSSVKSNSKYKCVKDEFDFIEEYLKKHNAYTMQNEIFVNKLKIEIYKWNMLRLDENGQFLFWDAIKDEMGEYSEKRMEQLSFTTEEKDDCGLLKRKDRIRQHNENKERLYEVMKQFIANIKNGAKYIVVGAGNYFHNLYLFQCLTDCNFIKMVCDNDIKLQGCERNGYIIQSVFDTAKNQIQEKWIIANKKYANEIFEQLRALDVKQENILCFNDMLSYDEMMQIYREE